MASLNKKHSLLAELGALLAAMVLGLYFLPQFVDITKYKPFIEEQVEKLAGFDIDIKGAVTFEVLPKPSIILKNIGVKNMGAGEHPVFMTANQLFISIDVLELVRGRLKMENMVMDSGRLDFAAFKRSNAGKFNDFLTGSNFENLAFRNSAIVLSDDADEDVMKQRIYDINFNFRGLSGAGVAGNGSFSWRGNKVSNMAFRLNFFDVENYNLNTSFSYANRRSSLDADMSLVKKDGERIISGSAAINTPSLYEFLPQIDERLVVPDIPFFREQLSVRTNIQTTSDAVILSGGVVDSGDTFANWSGTIPYRTDADGNFHVPDSGMEMKIDFRNARLDKFVALKKGFVYDPVAMLSGNRSALSLFRRAKLAITARNVVMDGHAATSAVLSTSPVFVRGGFSGIKIEELSFNLAGGQFAASGTVSGLDSDIRLSVDVARAPPFNFPNPMFRNTGVGSFKGRLDMTADSVSATGLEAELSGNRITGSADRKPLPDGRVRYDLDLRSDSFNMNAATGEKMDLHAMLSKLSLLKDVELSVALAFRKLSAGGEDYENLRLEAEFADDDLDMRRLTFRSGGYSSDVRGRMTGISGGSGSFDNFKYVITSDNLKGVSIPMIHNSFIDRIVANGVNRVSILLNGPADNPTSNIDAQFENIKVDIGGQLMDSQSDYHVHIEHNELKGFLFSWGFIDDRLAEHMYDGVPFTLDADVEGRDVRNISLTVKGNRFSGEILRREAARGRGGPLLETSINLSIPRLDLRAIFKRIKDVDGYADLMLKMIRALKHDITLDAPEVIDYDSNVYRNLKLSLSNIRNPGALSLSIAKGARQFSLSSEILNGRIFEGSMQVENYAVPGDLMDNGLLNLAGGTMDGRMTFKTDGDNSYQLTSNLSGGFSVEIRDGGLTGISGYDTMLASIAGLANITTNSVLYALEEGFRSGRLDFSNFAVSGAIENADVSGAAFTLAAKNIAINGFISTNLVKKSLSVESVFDITGLSFDTLTLIYNLSGFVNNLDGKLDTAGLISKINTFYLQKKKRELMR